MTTKITINYADGREHTFTANDLIEEHINKGEFFTVVMLKSDDPVDLGRFCRLYAGNPIAALGNMCMLHKTAGDDGDCPQDFLDGVTACIELMANEVTNDGCP